MKKQTIRADKLLSSLGLTSRRRVQVYLTNNSITADGKRIMEHGDRVSPKAEIKINGSTLKRPHKVYFLLNKPKGIVSTSQDEFGRKNVVSLIKTTERIYPVGSEYLSVLKNQNPILCRNRMHSRKGMVLKYAMPSS